MFLTVTAGQVLEDIHVRNINSDNCVAVTFPGSPDGLFAAMPETCSAISTQEAQAVLRGTITYQAPPTPASVVYFISPEQWYMIELPVGDPSSILQHAGGSRHLSNHRFPGWQSEPGLSPGGSLLRFRHSH